MWFRAANRWEYPNERYFGAVETEACRAQKRKSNSHQKDRKSKKERWSDLKYWELWKLSTDLIKKLYIFVCTILIFITEILF